MEGWIKLHRKIIEWEWYTDHVVRGVFIHCLIKSNHSERKWRGITIKPGQFITSISNLSNETGYSKKQVRRAIEVLYDSGELGKQTTNSYTCISISYYDKYQSEGKQKANEGQTKGKRRATTKNDKNKENDKNDNKYILSKSEICEILGGKIYDSFFDDFEEHLKIRKKQKAVNSYKAIKTLIGQLEKLSNSPESTKEIVNKSIINSWKGYFKSKENGQNYSDRKPINADSGGPKDKYF